MVIIRIRKGASDAIRNLAQQAGNPYPNKTAERVKIISSNGETTLVVSDNQKVIGVIELQDIIKSGIQERFGRLRKMGLRP